MQIDFVYVHWNTYHNTSPPRSASTNNDSKQLRIPIIHKPTLLTTTHYLRGARIVIRMTIPPIIDIRRMHQSSIMVRNTMLIVLLRLGRVGLGISQERRAVELRVQPGDDGVSLEVRSCLQGTAAGVEDVSCGGFLEFLVVEAELVAVDAACNDTGGHGVERHVLVGEFLPDFVDVGLEVVG